MIRIFCDVEPTEELTNSPYAEVNGYTGTDGANPAHLAVCANHLSQGIVKALTTEYVQMVTVSLPNTSFVTSVSPSS